jgi:hypothetical protein
MSKFAFTITSTNGYVVYPADNGMMTTSATHIQAAAFFYLASVYCLVAYWRTSRLLWLIGVDLSLGVSLGTYEAGYPLVFFTPLILVWLEKRISRQVLWVAGLWYLAPVLGGGRSEGGKISYQKADASCYDSLQ